MHSLGVGLADGSFRTEREWALRKRKWSRMWQAAEARLVQCARRVIVGFRQHRLLP